MNIFFSTFFTFIRLAQARRDHQNEHGAANHIQELHSVVIHFSFTFLQFLNQSRCERQTSFG
jgi:hypothetical protein